MDTGTEKTNLDWLNPEVLVEFIDELREAGYKIGISQYIATQDLILMLISQGEILDSPEHLKNLLGPIFCSSPIEQEDFQQRFNRWVELFNQPNLSIGEVNVEAEALSVELKTEHALFSRMQRLIFFISIFIFLSIILFPLYIEEKSFIEPLPKPIELLPKPTEPLPKPTEPLPKPTEPLLQPTEPLPKPIGILPTVPLRHLQFDWQILLFLLTLYIVAFIIWRLWWLWRANLFLQRHSTTQQPELQKISITGFEEKLVPSIVLLQIARSLRYRVHIRSNELDVDKTMNATLRQGGWLTPVYRDYQVIPEYLFLVNRASYRDHQAKFVEEIIKRLKNEGVFITIYFFDDDPRMCFPDTYEGLPLKLREIRSKYNHHYLVIISNTEKFFSSISGELEPWVNQLINWEERAFLTPTPAENWGYQELKIAQQFIILPATITGLLVLSQRLRQGGATYLFSEEKRIPIPDSLRIHPYLWIERNSPPTEQINVMLDSLEKYLGKDNFYWLSACAVFPELDWNITIYLGNVLKTESETSLIEVCSLADLARLPWFRYGYMPDWLRIYLITTLTQEQQQIIRTVLQDLLITAVQGSVSKLQLEIANQYHNLLPKLAHPILDLLSKKAAVDSPLRDYIFLGFMRGQSILSIKVSDEFSRVLRKQKRYYWWIKVLQKLGILIKPPIHQPKFSESANSTSSFINRRQFLKWFGLGGVGLLTSVVAHHVTKNFSQYLNILPNSKPTPLENFEFEIIRVNSQGTITNRANREAKYFAEDVGNDVNLEMVAIPGGSFTMGSPEGEQGRSADIGQHSVKVPEFFIPVPEVERFDNESPQHEVTVPGFFMGKYAITQAQYQAIMGANPAYFKGERRPVENVSWDDAVEFCQKLSQMTGRKYRLPSEAEWEYACRAGTTTPFYFGGTITTELVNYNGRYTYASEPKGESREETTEVGSFSPNAFGLYDMHGNVWEWCQDTWHKNYEEASTDGSPWLNNDLFSRLLRGGSWVNNPNDCRSAYRNYDNLRNLRNYFVGFRVVCAVVRAIK